MRNLLAALMLAVALPASAMANDTEALEQVGAGRAADIESVLKGERDANIVFSPGFLKEVPASQLEALTAQLTAEHGAVTGIDDFNYTGNGAATFDIVFENARADATLQLDMTAPYRVSGFRITNVVPIDDTPMKILEDFSALPGQAGFGVYLLDGGEPQSILTDKAYRQLAVGSTFKLYVLSALAREISAGERKWSDVVVLGTPSLPSGQLQDWPRGSPVTLHTLATMMISISDNTATDTLIRLLGRQAIEAELVASGHSDIQAALPILTTTEFFVLKNEPARVAEWKAASDAKAKEVLLAEWAPSLTAANANLGKLMTAGPTAIDSIEWFASSEDIARIFMRLRDVGDPVVLDILGINTVMSEGEASSWDYAGYKGGSETGVLNLSWLLKDRQGRWFSVSLSWNDPTAAVDEGKFIMLGKRLIGMLQQ